MSTARPPWGGPLLRLAETLSLRALQARGFRRRHLPTGLGRVHVLDARGRGQGPPLLVLHGLGSAGADLAPLLLALRRHTRRLIAPDLPGHGWSALPPPDARTGAELHVAITGILKQLDAGPVVVIGNSLGGLVGLRVALHRPEAVAGLVLLSPGGAPTDDDGLDALLRRFELRDQADALRFVRRLQARPSSAASRWLQAWGIRHRMARPGTRVVLEGATTDHLLAPEDLARLDAPTLVLWGRQERILPPEHLRFWRAHLPAHAVLEQPEGVGHAPYLDALRPVTRRIAAFLRELSDADPSS